MRTAIISALFWIGFIFAFGIIGAVLSFHTGNASELPKWNGWTYVLFSIRELAIIGVIFSIPIVTLVYFILWVLKPK